MRGNCQRATERGETNGKLRRRDRSGADANMYVGKLRERLHTRREFGSTRERTLGFTGRITGKWRSRFSTSDFHKAACQRTMLVVEVGSPLARHQLDTVLGLTACSVYCHHTVDQTNDYSVGE
jgi:hypothetical protein